MLKIYAKKSWFINAKLNNRNMLQIDLYRELCVNRDAIRHNNYFFINLKIKKVIRKSYNW